MPKHRVVKMDEWTPDNPDKLFAKTLGELVKEIPKGVSLRMYVRTDHEGELYLMVHGKGWGAAHLEKMLIDAGIIKTEPDAKIVEKAEA